MRICGQPECRSVFTICISCDRASAIAGQRADLLPGADSGTTPIAAISKVRLAERRTAAASSVIGRGLPEHR